MNFSRVSSALFLLSSLAVEIIGFVIPFERRLKVGFKPSNHNLLYIKAVLSTCDNQSGLDDNSLSTEGILLNLLDNLRSSPKLPYHFTYYDSGRETRLCVRNLEMIDLRVAVQLCLKEYGSYPSTKKYVKNSLLEWVQDKMILFDNFVFSFVVLLGLSQRVERRERCMSDLSVPQDHNVICISEIDESGREKIFGMAEVSLQSSDPSRTSPPFVTPPSIKKILGLSTPYISNVLITNEYRGYGYSKFLMAACEGLALSWGHNEVYLHVDASASGTVAQKLYISSGYRPVINETYNKNFKWMGLDGVNKGLYIIDGVALLFLKKAL